ncbi:MAG: peptidyl-prolyl cis-trans isomerase C [Alphaproteobacteria bacterium]|jgi:peptidyl-prolyl cis-trans isomerase C
MKKFVIPALLALSLTACNEGSSFSNSAKVGTAIATVNGVNITKEEVERNFATIPANLIVGKEEAIRKSIVDQLIKQELVFQSADKSNLMSDKEFKDLFDNMRRNFAYNYTVNKAVKDAVTEDAIKAEYEKNKETYKYATIKARHILQKTEAEAKNIIQSLNAGEDFVKLATAKSTGPSAKTGGDLGWFKANDMVPSFAKVAFAMEKGTYTKEPVKTQFGWHVILVEDKKADNIAAYEMVKQPLQQNLTNQAMQAYLEGLKEGAKIKMIEAKKAVASQAKPKTDIETNDVVMPETK